MMRLAAACALGCALAIVPVGAQEPRDAAAPAPRQEAASTSAPAAKPEEQIETLEEIVARVRRRLAEEQAGRPARPRTPTPPPRVTLVWRPSIVWPSELTGSSIGAEPERATLTWTSLDTHD